MFAVHCSPPPLSPHSSCCSMVPTKMAVAEVCHLQGHMQHDVKVHRLNKKQSSITQSPQAKNGELANPSAESGGVGKHLCSGTGNMQDSVWQRCEIPNPPGKSFARGFCHIFCVENLLPSAWPSPSTCSTAGGSILLSRKSFTELIQNWSIRGSMRSSRQSFLLQFHVTPTA